MLRHIFSGIMIIMVFVGVYFRFYNLSGKVYSHDEVYTSLRSAGYWVDEIESTIFQNRIIKPELLRQYLDIKPGSSFWDTIDSLAIEDPQHPPLYFLLTRSWMKLWGNDIVTMRLLPAILSLAALPFMYALAQELFDSRQIALIATAFQALSPYDILFAQIARQYSLLTVVLLANNLCFLRMQRLKQWLIYGVITAMGLYVHPFFCFTTISHGLLAVLTSWQKKHWLLLRNYCLAMGVTLVLYSPWIIVLATNYRRALLSTSWTGGMTDWNLLPRQWIVAFSSVFFDLNFNISIEHPLTILIRIPIILLAIGGIVLIAKQLPKHREFMLAFFVPFLILFLVDLFLGGKRSGITRYLVPCFPVMLLSVAYLLQQSVHSTSISTTKSIQVWLSRLTVIVIFIGSTASATVSARSQNWWTHSPTFVTYNSAQFINEAAYPLLISDRGDEYINSANLLSLSLLLDDRVKILLLDRLDLKNMPAQATTFVFNPSAKLKNYLGEQNFQVIPESQERLVQIREKF